MHRRALLTLAAVLVLLMCGSVLAQDKPLRVEILTTSPQQRDPILVHVTNLTTKMIQLALPLYFYGRQSLISQTLASDPLDIEQKKGRRWVEIPLGLPELKPSGSTQIEAGQTREYRFGVVGAGEYRVRVWYVVSPPQPGPPPRPAELRSVASAPIRIK
jgi:hypothetical protein